MSGQPPGPPASKYQYGQYGDQGQQPGYPQPGYPNQGPPQQGYPNQGPPQQGYPNQGPPNQGYPNQGPPNQGYPNQGPPNMGYPNQGPPNQGYAPPQGQPGYGAPGAPPSAPNWQVPDDDPEDDERRQPSAPPPPDLNQLPQFAGLTIGGPGQFQPVPAPALPPQPDRPPPHAQFDSCAQLSEEDCREALLEYVGQHCCYGKGPAQDMAMTQFLASTALRYHLETFCEGRGTSYEFTPFTGQPIDGPQNGVPPGPWDILVTPEHDFKTHEKKVEVPHTASVRPCHGCAAFGFTQCHRCYGRGRVRCSSCHGRGTRMSAGDDREQCTWCHGSGRRRCNTCSGDGRVMCVTCQGRCQLKWFVQLTVKFENHSDDFIIENSDLPDHLVREVQSNTVFEQTLFYCWPITDYPVEGIGKASNDLIEKHKTAFNAERRLNQRQSLLAIPVTEVHYTYKEKPRRYWVYGLDKRVYIEDYPATCCWGCSIL